MPLCVQRPPLLYFFHVLHQDYVRKNSSGVFVHRPRQDSQSSFPRFPAFCLAVTGAIRARPHQCHMSAIHILFQVNLKNILRQMQRVQMIGLMHQDSIRIMIDGNIYRTSQCHLYPHTRPASAGKAVNNQFVHPPSPPISNTVHNSDSNSHLLHYSHAFYISDMFRIVNVRYPSCCL